MGNIGKLSKITGLGGAVGAINKLIDAVNRLTPITSPSVKPSYTGSGISYRVQVNKKSLKPAKIPTDFDIYKVEDNKITIYGGTIIIGDREITTDDTTLTISTETAIIGWEYDYADTLTLKNFGSSFVTDPSYIRRKLYKFTKDESNIVTLTRIYKPEIYPSNFGNEQE